MCVLATDHQINTNAYWGSYNIDFEHCLHDIHVQRLVFKSNRGPDLTDQESQDSVYYSRRSFPRRAVCEQILKAACLYDDCLIIRRFRKSSRIVLDGRWSCQSRVTHKKDKKGVVLVAQWHVCGFGYGILTAAPSLISRCISCSWQSTAQTSKYY
jgi:hypothetical protein